MASLVISPWFGAVIATAGGVKSKFSVTVSGVCRPALSIAVPGNVCAGPSANAVTGDGQLAIPRLSEQRKVTVAGVLLQVFRGVGNTLAVMVGFTESIV